ncbi:MAG: DUF4097 family beta strand repeat protein [Bacteroidetes bacterium]|nr:DUF4097 family beta strand repeat protein [Bacteroidota bacterium]
MKNLLFLVLVLSFPVMVFSQQKVEVVTKQYERRIPFKNGESIEVKGEKANISIEEYNGNEVVLIVTFTARHPEKAIADMELNYMRYTFQNTKTQVQVDNYFVLPKNVKKVNSNLQAELLIQVPKGVSVKTYNYFGTTVIKNVTSGIIASSEYGSLTLENCSGPIKAQTNFSEIKIFNPTYVFILANNSELTISGISGELNFSGENSDINVNASGIIKGSIELKNGDIRLTGLALSKQSFEIVSNNGRIEAPVQLKTVKENNFTKVNHQLNSALPLFKINSSFGKILIL